VEAREAILGWPNLLARELYTEALQRAESENRDVSLEDAQAAWPIAVQRLAKRILKDGPRTKKQRGKTDGKAA
jgi:hypothetical protein